MEIMCLKCLNGAHYGCRNKFQCMKDYYLMVSTRKAERFVLTQTTNLKKVQDHSQWNDAMSMRNALSIVGMLPLKYQQPSNL